MSDFFIPEPPQGFRPADLALAYYGEPILRKKAAPVEEVNDDIHHLIWSMVVAMEKFEGIGLAATQVFIDQRLFIVLDAIPDEGTDEDRGFKWGKPKVYINPVLSDPLDEIYLCQDACLSIPKLHSVTERPAGITITAQNFYGEELTEVVTGFPASMLMHENDHLNGVLFVDRLSPKKRSEVDSHLKKLKKKTGENRKKKTR